MVPYLDLLNHSSEVEVTAGIYSDPLRGDSDVKNAGYRIVTHTPVKKHQQVIVKMPKYNVIVCSRLFIRSVNGKKMPP